jgi:ATP-dependent exoDNAse (exonuclease V) alpha subunit
MRTAKGKRTYSPNRPKITHKTVLVVDEAGMIGTRTMSKLFEYVEKAGATVVLVGDTKQLPPIEAGGPFTRVIQEVAPAQLNENRRLKNRADVRATNWIRNGDVKKALQDYLERGRLVIEGNRVDAAKRLVEDWSKDGSLKKPEGSIILTETRAEAREINRFCQLSRLLSGHLSSKSVAIGSDRFHERDRIMFHKPFRMQGIENGFQATILRINRITREVTIRLDNKPQVRKGFSAAKQVVTLTFDQMKDAEAKLAYASTTHKMQGQTVDRCYVLMGGPMTSQEITYVQATRARYATKFYIDRAHAGEQLMAIEKEIAKSRLKQLAHDIAQVTPTTSHSRG